MVAEEKESGDESPAIHLDHYEQYLNSICSRLTPQEEARVVAENKGNPRLLAGLVLAGTMNAQRLLEEALQVGNDEPLVHYAILCSGSSLDKVKSALALSAAAPTDSEPLYMAASELVQ